MARTIPSLTSGLHTIARGATDTTRAIIEAAGTGSAEVIPMETLTIMSQVSETIEHSLSYYSMEEIPLESGAGNLGAESIGTNVGSVGGSIPGPVVTNIGAGAAHVGPGVGTIGGAILQGIVVSVISPDGEIIQSDLRQEINTSTAKENTWIDRIEKIRQKYVNDFAFGPLEDYNITERQTARLKHSLADWKNAFCYYEFPTNVFCRLPRSSHVMERLILIPLENLRRVFSENASGLCYSFWKDLWCNWGKFFDVLSIERNGMVNNDSCPWDQFLLTIEESSDNLYQIASKIREAGCYNETVMIRV